MSGDGECDEDRDFSDIVTDSDCVISCDGKFNKGLMSMTG
jgi:hypothetical protein